MASSPPTPPADEPKDDSQWRFPDSGYPCEWAESYRSGGFHPVNLGDLFKNGQYRIIRKLGDGSYSTVWLARDNVNFRYVALKIMIAKSSLRSETELSILKRIKDSTQNDPTAQHVMILLDTFKHSGPNGTHLCLVFEPMGSTAASMAAKLPQNQMQTRRTTIRYPKPIAKLILRHTLLGLAFLHESEIVHADLQPGNLLFAMSNIDLLSKDKLQQDQSQQDQSTTPQPLKRLDGKDDKWAPRHLFLGQSLHQYVCFGPEMLVKISDFGAAFWSEDPPKSTVTPVALRAPELIFGEEIGSSIDIWSFGCLIYEILTGTALFCASKLDGDDEADDDHLLELNDVLEPLPESWLEEKWPRANRYFGPNRERLDPVDDGEDEDLDDEAVEDLDGEIVEDPDHDGEDEDLDSEAIKNLDHNGEEGDFDVDEIEGQGDGPWINSPLEVLFEKNKPEDIDDAEAEVITSLIRKILKYEPSQRPSAAQLLEHPWFHN